MNFILRFAGTLAFASGLFASGGAIAAPGFPVSGGAACDQNRPCDSGEFCLLPDGVCDPAGSGQCQPIPENCFDPVDPVCGCDGSSYDNRCLALLAEVHERPPEEQEAVWREIALDLIAADQPWWIFKKAIRGPAGLYDLHTQQLRFLDEDWVDVAPREAYAMVVVDVIGYFGVMIPGIAALWLVPAGGAGRTRWLVVVCILYLTAVHSTANATPRFHLPLLPLFVLYIGPLLTGGVRWRAVARWRLTGAVATVLAFVAIPMPRTVAFLGGLWSGIGERVGG